MASIYSIAGLNVEMESSGDILRKQGARYRSTEDNPADITIRLSEERIKRFGDKYPHLNQHEREYLLTGAEFYGSLMEYNGFGLHASAIAMDNRAVLFSAPCNTGKSTHARLWQQYFGANRVVIINDDKPVLRLKGDSFQVYGTPWSGKTDLSANIQVPLQAVVFLEQAQDNDIKRLDHKEAVKMLIYQSLRPNNDALKMHQLLVLLDVLIKTTPVYRLTCTVSQEAVKLVHEALF